ncbi:hypothetical protein HXZ94_10695 [Empedobacter falsenii]|uniref:hypothetical protein n=1 Tax=Empedobacter falsenii TaxID=343874 RepID=UPI002575F17F|nr:hypothetical protein [Empedobacter falsenii]MDM1298963.1 hypothetical protein [Empedobacter falsenii]MDM1318756.1 hypothetical protein [Empedobacter falsenii]
MQLQIDKKCNQNWDEMTDANAQQKFCDVCSKCVHDLDHYSFKELKTFLNDNPTACVKIKTRNLEQFNSYEASKSISNQSKRWLQLSSLAGFLSFSTITKAQTESDSIAIQGIINDNNNFPVSDAEVNLKNSNKIVYTDDNGKFELKVPKGQSNYEIEYKEFVGDNIQSFSFINPEICQVIKSKEQTSEITLGAVAYTTYKQKNILRKVGRTISWPFRQIGKLF